MSRFKWDGEGWRVFASTQMMDVPVVTDQRRGAIGVDLNADHLAAAETDANCIAPLLCSNPLTICTCDHLYACN